MILPAFVFLAGFYRDSFNTLDIPPSVNDGEDSLSVWSLNRTDSADEDGSSVDWPHMDAPCSWIPLPPVCSSWS